MRYLVTDPCYLLGLDSKNKDRIWNLCINDMYNSDNSDNSDKYEERTDYTGVQKILSEELGVNVLRVSDTGYGDWSNSLNSNSNNINIIKSEFSADAGMMCVVEINEKLENFLKENDIGAIFETDREISVDVNTEDSSWYVLNIKDKNGWNTLAYSDEPEQEDDDYEEDYDDYEEDYDDYNSDEDEESEEDEE